MSNSKLKFMKHHNQTTESKNKQRLIKEIEHHLHVIAANFKEQKIKRPYDSEVTCKYTMFNSCQITVNSYDRKYLIVLNPYELYKATVEVIVIPKVKYSNYLQFYCRFQLEELTQGTIDFISRLNQHLINFISVANLDEQLLEKEE